MSTKPSASEITINKYRLHVTTVLLTSTILSLTTVQAGVEPQGPTLTKPMAPQLSNRMPATKNRAPEVSYTNLMPKREEVLSQVRMEYGQIIPEKDIPDLYQFLLEVFNNLGRAQEQIMEGSKASVNFVHIVQSKLLNAFVHKEETDGVRLQSNHLFITTGLIEVMTKDLREIDVVKNHLDKLNKNQFRNEMMKDPKIAQAIASSYSAIAGVMSHELGHSTSGVAMSDNGREDGVYIQDHWGAQGQQAEEVMADATGARILAKAGYDPKNVLKALEKLFAAMLPSRDGGLKAAASTHPDSDFRIASLAEFLTANRLEHGLPLEMKRFNIRAAVSFGALKDLDKLSLRNGRYPYVAPKSLAEINRRFDAVINDTQLSDEFKNIEFNRLLLSLDQMVAGYDNPDKQLSTAMAKDLADSYAAVARLYEQVNGNSIKIATPTSIRNLINKDTGTSGFEKANSHFTFIERSSTFKEKISPLIAKKLVEDYPLGSVDGNSVKTVLPFLTAQDFIDTYGNRFCELILSSYQLDGYSYSLDSLKDLFKDPQFTSNPSLVAKMFQKFFSTHQDFQQNPKKYQDLFAETLYMWAPFMFLREVGDVNATKPAQHLQMLYRQARIRAKRDNDPKAQEYIDSIRQNAQTIWDLRGFYGASEMFFRYSILNWRMIFEVLELNEGVAKNQIENAVQQYMLGKIDYQGKVAPFADLANSVRSSRNSYDHPGLEKHLIWNTHNLFAEVDKRSETTLSAPRYLVKQKAMYAREFEKTLKERLREPKDGSKMDPDNFVANINGHYRTMAGQETIAQEALAFDSDIYLKAYLNAMSDASISLSLRQAWFRDMFFKLTIPTKEKISIIESEIGTKTTFDDVIQRLSNTPTAARALKTYRLLFAKDSLSFIAELKQAAEKYNMNDQYLYGIVDSLYEELQKDFLARKVTGFNEVLDIAKLLHPMTHRKVSYEKSIESDNDTTAETLADSLSFQMNSGRIQKFKKTLVEATLPFNLSDEQKLKLFWEITETGASKYTDELFTGPMHIEEPFKRNIGAFVRALEEGRLSSATTRLNLTKFVLEDELTELHRHIPVNRINLKLLIDRINLYCPSGSTAKDDFLESIGVRLSLKGSELDGFIEDQKALNWRKANPMLIRIGSLMSVHIKKMKPRERYNWIEYLLDPVKNGTTLFDQIANDLKKIVYNDLLANFRGVVNPKILAELRQTADRGADALKLIAEGTIRESSAKERIPLFHVGLTSGENALMKAHDWPLNITRTFLKYQPDSIEEVLLKNFLKVLPEHEPGVAMAYMLALSTDPQKTSAAQLFEVFDTVGIKFGQLVSIWQLFGKEVAEQSQNLKSNARPLSRQEVINLAYDRAPQLKNMIADFIKQLGSASVKSSNLVRLKDGRLVVLALRREDVKEKIKMNLAMGRQYLDLLKKEKVIQNSKFMAAMVEALGEQLAAEIDFTQEAKKYKIVKEVVRELEKEMQDDLKIKDLSVKKGEPTHWKLDVPDVIEDLPLEQDIAAYTLASKETFDHLPESVKQEIGPIIAKLNLKMLFRYGYFDPDRHTGNIMVNRETKTIYFLDAGQLENFEKSNNPFKRDPRLILAEFMKAVKDKDQTGTINAAILMNKNDNDQFDRAALTEKIRKIYKTSHHGDTKAVLREVVNEIVEAGIKLDTRFMFGALKGLIVLAGENYAGPRVFEDIMTSEIKRLMITKAPLTLSAWFKNKFGNSVANIKDGIASVEQTGINRGAKYSNSAESKSTETNSLTSNLKPTQGSAPTTPPQCEDIVAK